MMALRVLCCSLLMVWLLLPASANEVSANWEGLVGIFTQPTAETLPAGSIALTFSEVRFSQTNDTTKLQDSWFTSSVTWVPISRLEVAVTSRNEVLRRGPAESVEFTERVDDSQVLAHLKLILIRPEPNRIGLALGVQDITDQTGQLDGIDVGRGRRIFLVGSYQWFHLGAFEESNKVHGFAGARWEVSDNIDLLAELVTRPAFVQTTPYPINKMNFNLGLRIHPRDVPNLRIDAAAIGDGQFDFGFSLSYNFRP
ncbi:MAG: hypothetical protein ACYDCO_06825 [Armatimonadota bacterium]